MGLLDTLFGGGFVGQCAPTSSLAHMVKSILLDSKDTKVGQKDEKKEERKEERK